MRILLLLASFFGFGGETNKQTAKPLPVVSGLKPANIHNPEKDNSDLRFQIMFPAPEQMPDWIPVQENGLVDDAYRTGIVKYDKQPVGFYDRGTGEIHRLEGVLLEEYRYALEGAEKTLFSLWRTNAFDDPKFAGYVTLSDGEAFIKKNHVLPNGTLEDLLIIPFARKDYVDGQFPKDKLPVSPIYGKDWNNRDFKGFFSARGPAKKSELLYTSRTEEDKNLDAADVMKEAVDYKGLSDMSHHPKRHNDLVADLKKDGWSYKKTDRTTGANSHEEVD